MIARIFMPARSAMTSGYANAKSWMLEYADSGSRRSDPLMGWSGGGDTRSQVRLSFDTKEEAIAYATRHGIPHVVEDAKPRGPNIRPRGYGGNFAHDRRGAWTH